MCVGAPVGRAGDLCRVPGVPGDPVRASPRLTGVNATLRRRTRPRSRSRRRAVAAALLIVPVSVPALTSCGVSFGAQTDQIYTPADGVNDRSGSVDVLNALIVSDTPGTGRLIAGLVNNDVDNEDALTGVRGAGDDSGIVYSLVSGDTAIPAGGALQLADPTAAMVAASGDPEKLTAGDFVRLVFSFRNGEEVELDVPVLAPGTTYSDVELPTPSETPKG